MESESRKTMVSSEQLNSLLDFMKKHPDLAKGLSRGRRGKLMTLKVWSSCANQLNAVKDGSVKDGKGWSKYWCDWKYRVRRHALELKAAKEGNRPTQDSLTPLSSIEETIMSIIGENTLDGVVIRTDPLADSMDPNEDEPDNEQNIEMSNTQGCATRSKNRKRRRNSSKEVSYFDNPDGPSSPPEKKASLGDIESDEDESTQFLRLEREKLENSRKSIESLQLIASELTRLTDVMNHIKEFLVNRFNATCNK